MNQASMDYGDTLDDTIKKAHGKSTWRSFFYFIDEDVIGEWYMNGLIV